MDPRGEEERFHQDIELVVSSECFIHLFSLTQCNVTNGSLKKIIWITWDIQMILRGRLSDTLTKLDKNKHKCELC